MSKLLFFLSVTLFFKVANRSSPPRRPVPPRPSPPSIVPPLTNGDRWLPAESHFVSENGNTLHVRFGGGLRSQQRPRPSAPPAPKEEEKVVSAVVGEAIGLRGNLKKF